MYLINNSAVLTRGARKVKNNSLSLKEYIIRDRFKEIPIKLEICIFC